jgi:very-short-patch-repair endonuclease
VSRRQLRTVGLSDSAISRLLGSDALEVIHRGVFLVRGAPLTYSARLWGAVLATDGMLGFGTAAHLWGMADQPVRIQVIVEETRRVTPPPGVQLRRTFTPRAKLTRRDGLPATIASWSLMDHLGDISYRDALPLADRALQRGWLTRAEIAHRLDELPCRRGNATLRRLLAATSDNAAAVSERHLHRLLRRAGITGWTANYAVWSNGELIAVIDVAFVEWRIALEVDGWAYHSDVARFQRDRQRQNLLINLGWKVLRFTWADLTERPQYVLATIRAAA